MIARWRLRALILIIGSIFSAASSLAAPPEPGAAPPEPWDMPGRNQKKIGVRPVRLSRDLLLLRIGEIPVEGLGKEGGGERSDQANPHFPVPGGFERFVESARGVETLGLH